MAARMDSLLDHIFAVVPEAQVFLADVVGTGMFFQGCTCRAFLLTFSVTARGRAYACASVCFFMLCAARAIESARACAYMYIYIVIIRVHVCVCVCVFVCVRVCVCMCVCMYVRNSSILPQKAAFLYSNL